MLSGHLTMSRGDIAHGRLVKLLQVLPPGECDDAQPTLSFELPQCNEEAAYPGILRKVIWDSPSKGRWKPRRNSIKSISSNRRRP
ncbi:hypothetical protein RJ55_03154 [Drechmeria coniospora]|nr:hypothetical protein RJ55_03154 [Drechmeria coniospora]